MKILLDTDVYPTLNNSILFAIHNHLKDQGVNVSIVSNENLLKFYDLEVPVNDFLNIRDCCLMFFRIKRINLILKSIIKYKKTILIINKNTEFLNFFSIHIGVKFLNFNDYVELPDDLFLNIRCIFPVSNIYKNKISNRARNKFKIINNKIYYPILRRSSIKKIKINKCLSL